MSHESIIDPVCRSQLGLTNGVRIPKRESERVSLTPPEFFASDSALLAAAVRCALPAVAVGVALLLPYLANAFTVDDVTFLLQAQHLLTDPLHPTAFDMVFHGRLIRVSSELVTGPVMAFLLVPAVWLGGAEWAAHGVQLALVLVSLVATAALALRVGCDRRQATLASLLVITSPAVLGMATTAMADVPAMAFTILGMERLGAWRSSRSLIAGVASALFLALGTLARPHVLLAVGCGALWLVDKRWCTAAKRPEWRSLLLPVLPIAIALLLIGVVVFVTRDPASGTTIAGATAHRTHLGLVAFNLSSFSLHWATTFPLVALWTVARGRRLFAFRRVLIALPSGLLLGAAGGYLARADWWRGIPALVLVAISTVVLADIVGSALERRDHTQLVLGLWLLTGAATAFYVQLPAKVLLPAAPAMAILVAREPVWLSASALRRTVFWVIASSGVTLGLLIIDASRALAEIGRIGGRTVAVHVARGERVWLDGAWGFQWYAMRAGARPLSESPPYPQPGDVVVASTQARLLRKSYRNLGFVSREVFARPGGRVASEGAGFFTNGAGAWPWVWGRGELGRVEVWRIEPPRSPQGAEP
jgi:4-amino-4-deoxy-L-arabinose transferase-like glycosyltransferase